MPRSCPDAAPLGSAETSVSGQKPSVRGQGAGCRDTRSRERVDIAPPLPHFRGRRPDGGVVTQRTANPCTPVRFRLGPPLLPALSKRRSAIGAERLSDKAP